MRRSYILHPFLFALAPAVFLWSQNFSEVFLWEVLVTLAVLIAFGGLVFGAFWLAYREYQKAAVVASATLILTLFYKYIFFSPLSFQFMRHRWALLLLAAIIIAIACAVKKSKGDLAGPNKILAVVSAAFVALSLMQLAVNYYSSAMHNALAKLETVASGEVKDPRDIYYIILDEYTSPDILKNVLGFPDDKFADFLNDNGFYLPRQSRSNYPATYLSLASSLNMRYVNEYLDESTASRKVLTDMTQDHFLKDFFKAHGYRYIHFGADWVDHYNPYADENINIDTFSPYQVMVWDVSAFAPVAMTISGHGPVGEKLVFLNLNSFDFRLTQWERIRFQLEELSKVPARKDRPVFVFAHLLIPHDPFVFNTDGSFATKEEADARSQKENYLAQVAYINREMEKLVVRLQSSDPKPIIIIQGDHGHKFPSDADLLRKEYGLEPKQGANLMTRILNAYYLPGGGNRLLYDAVTPVNSFRIVLNEYFGQKLELLEDKSYSYGPPYNPTQPLEPVN